MIKRLWQKIKDWYVLRQLELELWEEVRSNIEIRLDRDPIEVFQDQTQHKYLNGMVLLKRKIKEQVTGKTIEEQDAVMRSFGEDMFNFAYKASKEKEQLTEILKSAYIFKDKDIKTEEDHTKMIDKRIQDMYNLQNKKLERQLLRDARKAFNSGDIDTHEQLMKEWSKKYGQR